MVLIIGGQAQGKLAYALNAYGYDSREVFDCETETDMARLFAYPVVNRLHCCVKKMMEQDAADEFFDRLLDGGTVRVLIANEIGLGIVPMDRAERAYREKTGRLLCRAAATADTVERICCGIPLRLKG